MASGCTDTQRLTAPRCGGTAAVLLLLILGFLPAVAKVIDNGGPNGDDHVAAEVFQQMKTDGKLMAVYFHGSDWCDYGERIRRELWNAPGFRETVEKKFHRLHCDWRDYVFKLRDACTELLNASVANDAAFESPTADSGATFTATAAAEWQVSGGEPAQSDTYTVSFTVTKPATDPVFVLTLPDGDSYGDRGPGRPDNGAVCLSEVRVLDDDTPRRLFGAWTDRPDKSHPAVRATDGDLGGENYWHYDHSAERKDGHLVFGAEGNFMPNHRYAVQLKFHSRWPNHAAKRLALLMTAVPELAAPIREREQIAQHEADTAPIRSWPHVFPSISVFDADGRLCGNIAQLETRTEADVLAWLDAIATAVSTRDRCFAVAASLKDAAKADKLAEGLAAMGQFYAPAGQNKNKAWESIRNWKEYKELRKIDSEDKTGFKTHLEFTWVFNDARTKATNAANVAEAEKLAAELSNSHYLTPAQRQMASFLPYYFFKKNGDREQMVAITKRALAMPVEGDERERWFALGLEGLLCMLDAGPVAIPYGWRDQHCTPEFEWRIKTGVRRCFRLPAMYRVSFHPGVGIHMRGLPQQPGGSDTLLITEVALLVDGKSLWTTTPENPLTLSGELGGGSVDLTLERDLPPTAVVELRVRGTATGSDSRGEILVSPFLDLE